MCAACGQYHVCGLVPEILLLISHLALSCVSSINWILCGGSNIANESGFSWQTAFLSTFTTLNLPLSRLSVWLVPIQLLEKGGGFWLLNVMFMPASSSCWLISLLFREEAFIQVSAKHLKAWDTSSASHSSTLCLVWCGWSSIGFVFFGLIWFAFFGLVWFWSIIHKALRHLISFSPQYNVEYSFSVWHAQWISHHSYLNILFYERYNCSDEILHSLTKSCRQTLRRVTKPNQTWDQIQKMPWAPSWTWSTVETWLSQVCTSSFSSTIWRSLPLPKQTLGELLLHMIVHIS